MLSLDDVKNVSFRKSNIGGYKAEDVDDFINKVEETFNQFHKEKNDLLKKIEILAKKVEDYLKDENYLKIALINAQKMSDASLREAKQKAEAILRDAEEQAKKTVKLSKEQCRQNETLMENMKKEALEFKTSLLNNYKEHLNLINNMLNENAFSEKPKSNYKNNTLAQQDDKDKNTVQEEELKSEPTPSQDQESMGHTQVFDNKPRLKFSNLKFGEHYSISEDDESPIGLFK